MPLARRFFYRRFMALLVAFISLLSGSLLSVEAADSVSLAWDPWDPNVDSDVAGYRLHYGTTSGGYTEAIDLGNVTTATVSDLIVGNTYYFVVTAYSSTGLESLPSEEIPFTATPNATPQVVSSMERRLDGSFQFTVTNPAGESVSMAVVDVYVSSDLQSWTLLSRLVNQAGKLVVNDPGAAWVPRRFYRVTVQ